MTDYVVGIAIALAALFTLDVWWRSRWRRLLTVLTIRHPTIAQTPTATELGSFGCPAPALGRLVVTDPLSGGWAELDVTGLRLSGSSLLVEAAGKGPAPEIRDGRLTLLSPEGEAVIRGGERLALAETPEGGAIMVFAKMWPDLRRS